MIHQKKMEKRIFLKGTTNHVEDVLRRADIFAFPSAYEGFSLALGEAMSMGLPSVAFKSCESVCGMIEDGKTGILCADGVQPFQDALQSLMQDRELRVEIGRNARAAMKSFAPDVIWDKWENLLMGIVKEHR